MRLGLGLSITGRLRSSGASFILNRFSGAAAAYSLRKLSASATNVVRVRRSSDNAELDFTPSEINDGSLLTWVGAGDGLVTTWYDQSGNANHATQTTAASQPKIVDGGVLVTEGGKAALDFDGIQDLRAPKPVTDTFSMLSVKKISNTTGLVFDGVPTVGGGNYSWVYAQSSTSTNIENFGNPDLYVNGTLEAPVTRGDVYNLFDVGQHLESSINGDMTQWSVFDISRYIDGTFIGTISEIILYPSDQSANRTSIEANIADYYGITLT